MRNIVFLFSLSFYSFSYGQTFTDQYVQNRVAEAYKENIKQGANISVNQLKKYKRNLNGIYSAQAFQFDTVFKAYQVNSGFDFNMADSITILFQTHGKTQINDFIFISGHDTISYGETYLTQIDRSTKAIVYKPFVDKNENSQIGLYAIRDSLLKILHEMDLSKVYQLAIDNPSFDGSSTTITVAKKINGVYHFKTHFFRLYNYAPKIKL